MAKYDSPPNDTGYPSSKDSDILTELLIQGQMSTAQRLEQEAIEEGATPNNPVPYGVPGVDLAAQPANGYTLEPPYTPRTASTSSSFQPDFILEDEEAGEVEIPDGAFLLRCGSGDVILWPEGISFEDHFIVLFFRNRRDLHFIPKINTNFRGEYDLPMDEDDSVRQTLDLYYSGITFTIPESETVSVIFHLRSNAQTPTGFVPRAT